MQFFYNDGGRRESLRPKQKRDCVIRAIAIIMSRGYDSVYDALAEMGRKCSRGTPKNIWKTYLSETGYFQRIPFPATKGKARMSLEHFCIAYPEGKFIVQCAGHLTAVINGAVCDDFIPRENACVYAVWKLK